MTHAELSDMAFWGNFLGPIACLRTSGDSSPSATMTFFPHEDKPHNATG
jgi:hypothetical protein